MALILFGARTAYDVFHCNVVNLRYPKKKSFLDVFSLNLWAQQQVKAETVLSALQVVV
jgi:hypothetical protein